MQVICDNYKQFKSTNDFLIVKLSLLFSGQSEMISVVHRKTQNFVVQKFTHNNQRSSNSRLNQISLLI